MMSRKRFKWPVAAALLLSQLIGAESMAADNPRSLDDLIKQVHNESVLESRELEAREQVFRQARDNKAALLQALKSKLAAERARGAALKQRYEENDPFIQAESERLHERMGSLGELFGVVRQTSKDVQSLFNVSLISAQLPDREPLVKRLAERKSNPTIQEMEDFWYLLLDEMVQSGKVKRFEAPVITIGGEEQRREVVRIGAFNVVSDGVYLRYLPETGRLVELGRQPSSRYTDLARELQQTKTGIAPVALDPSRGAILSLMVQSPDLGEHVNQGGVIGYMIIMLGVIGLVLIAERAVVLMRLQRRMSRQRHGDDTGEDSPLTRLRQVERDNPLMDAETLGLKLDQVILSERPAIKRFLPTVSIFAGVTPLLGLLGTVTGMIETFQSITLFGNGDPKLMSSGISVALVTTELGLIVSIPLLLSHNWLSGGTRKVIYMLDEESAAIVARREESLHAVGD